MWLTPKFQRRKAKPASQTPKPAFHLQRTAAQVVILSRNETIPTNLVLNELTARGAIVYSSSPMEIGQRVHFSFEVPNPFESHGTILSCQSVLNSNRIISKQNYSYRVFIQFESPSV